MAASTCPQRPGNDKKGEGKGTEKESTSLPGGNDYTSLWEELQSWDSHTEKCGGEVPVHSKPTYAKVCRANVYGPQALLVNAAPDPNHPLSWYPREANDLKELRKAR